MRHSKNYLRRGTFGLFRFSCIKQKLRHKLPNCSKQMFNLQQNIYIITITKGLVNLGLR